MLYHLSYRGESSEDAPDGTRTRNLYLMRVCMLLPLGTAGVVRFVSFVKPIPSIHRLPAVRGPRKLQKQMFSHPVLRHGSRGGRI